MYVYSTQSLVDTSLLADSHVVVPYTQFLLQRRSHIRFWRSNSDAVSLLLNPEDLGF